MTAASSRPAASPITSSHRRAKSRLCRWFTSKAIRRRRSAAFAAWAKAARSGRRPRSPTRLPMRSLRSASKSTSFRRRRSGCSVSSKRRARAANRERANMELGLEGKIAVVTGGASGVGREIALSLAAEGAWVAVNYRSSGADAETLAGEIVAKGGKAKAYKADVADLAAVKAMVDDI